MKLSKSHFKISASILLIWILVTSLNITKAVHIDDTLYLKIAEHIKKNPLHPMSGKISWDYSSTESIHETQAPPFLSYLYALTMHLFGKSEIALHFLISLFSLCAIIFFYLLIKQIASQQALIITAVFCLGPAFIPSQNLMLDIPITALWIVFFWLLLDFKSQRPRRYILAAIVCSIACLIKYTSVILIPILVLSILLRKKWRLVWIVCIPLLVLVGWSLFNYFDYGGIHILGRPTYPINLNILYNTFIEWLLCLGAVSPFSIILFLQRKDRFIRLGGLIIVAVAFFFCMYFIAYPIDDESKYNIILRAGFFSNGFFLLTSILYYIFKNLFKPHTMRSSNNKMHYLILILWLLGSMAFIILFAPFIAVRHLLPVIPVILLILCLNNVFKIAKRWLYVTMAVSIFFGVILGISDWKYADLYRVQAKRIGEYLRTQSENTIWHVGHWGWEWHASKEGIKPYDLNTHEPQEGSLIIVPLLVDKQAIAEKHLNRLKMIQQISIEATPSTFVRTMSAKPWGGYYCLPFNGMPWKWSKAPLEEFSIYRFENHEK